MKKEMVLCRPVAGIACAALLLVSCQTIQPDSVSKFSQGVSQSHQQMDTAFHDVNTLAQAVSISIRISNLQTVEREGA